MTTPRPPKPRRDTLSDGTPIASLIDRDKREVSPRVFSDPEIHQFELERLFAKTWIIVAHESEVPDAGDFVTRTIGNDPVIVTRNRDGGIEVLLNVCTHRGTLVAREEAGHANVFRCIYHGWVFNLDGSIRGMPWKDQMYPEGSTDFRAMALPKARVGVYAGIVFANWDPSAPSLDDYLGDYKRYMDLSFGRLPAGMEVLGAPQRFVVNANWKTSAEQFGGDAYHVSVLHKDLGKLFPGDPMNPADWQMLGTKVSTDQGHNIICFDLNRIFNLLVGDVELSQDDKLDILPPPGVPRDMLATMKQHLSQEDIAFLMNTPPAAGGVFPNSGIWNMYNPMPNAAPVPFTSFRTFVPISPDKFEFCMWVLVGKGASEEYREMMRRATTFTQGAAGFIEGDDGAVWPGQQIGSRGYIAREQITYKYWSLTGEHKPEGWPAGGHVHAGFSRDDPQWNWWQRYFDRLEAKV